MPGYVKAIALMSSGLGDEVGDSVMIGDCMNLAEHATSHKFLTMINLCSSCIVQSNGSLILMKFFDPLSAFKFIE